MKANQSVKHHCKIIIKELNLLFVNNKRKSHITKELNLLFINNKREYHI